MNRASKDVEVNGTVYHVEELPAREMLPMVSEMGEDLTADAQFAIMSKAVSINGVNIDAGDLGMATYMKLMNIVMELNGMGTEQGDKGND